MSSYALEYDTLSNPCDPGAWHINSLKEAVESNCLDLLSGRQPQWVIVGIGTSKHMDVLCDAIIDQCKTISSKKVNNLELD